MAVSPICEVRDGLGAFVPTVNGVDLTPGNTISIRLGNVTDVTEWYLEVTGTDELSTAPTLTGVNPTSHKVSSPGTVVTFTMPVAQGSAFLFTSTVMGSGGPVQTTFGLYTLTGGGRRVGAVGETRETNSLFGWAATVNPVIRNSFTPAGDLGGTVLSQTVVGLRGRAVATTAPSDGQVLKWNAGSSQWEPGTGGGGSITLGGDLGDWTPASSDKQRVVGVDTLIAPLSSTAQEGRFVRASLISPFLSPRAIIVDGLEAWVSEHDQSSTSYPLIRRMSLVDGTIAATVDLTPYGFSGVRDLAQDATYVYCACWREGLIAIISKATNAVVGWGSLPDLGVVGRQVTSVCADGAGNFYAVGYAYLSGTPTHGIFKFSAAACLGAAPDTVGPTSVRYDTNLTNARKIRYGFSSLWVAGGFSGNGLLFKIDPADLSQLGVSLDTTFGMNIAFTSTDVIVVDKTPQGLRRYDPTTVTLVGSFDLGDYLPQPDGISIITTMMGSVAVVTDVARAAPNGRAVLIDIESMMDLGAVSVPSNGCGEVVNNGSAFFITAYHVNGSSVPGVYRYLDNVVTLLAPLGLNCAPIDSLQGVPISPTAPTLNQVLRFDGTEWAPGTSGGGGGHVTASDSSGYINVPNYVTDLVITSFGSTVILPTAAADGEFHTISDGTGWAGYVSGGTVFYVIYIYDALFNQIGTIASYYGSLTFVWNQSLARWVVS